MLLKWCSSAGRLCQGFTVLGYPFSEETLAHIYSAVAREGFVCMTSCTVGSVSKCEKVTLIHINEPQKNLVSQDQVISQTSDFNIDQLLCSQFSQP